MLHIALVDWASDKQEEEARKAKQEGKGKQTWSEVVERQKKAKDDKAAIEAFESIDWLPPLEPEEDKNGPVFAFMISWPHGRQKITAAWQPEQ